MHARMKKEIISHSYRLTITTTLTYLCVARRIVLRLDIMHLVGVSLYPPLS